MSARPHPITTHDKTINIYLLATFRTDRLRYKNPNKIFIARENNFRNFKKIELAPENVKNYIENSLNILISMYKYVLKFGTTKT